MKMLNGTSILIINILKIKDIHRLRMLKFYFNLVQGNWSSLINVFLLHLTIWNHFYAFRKRYYLLPKVKHEFAKRGLTFKLIDTINKTSTLIKDKIYIYHSLQGYTTYIKNSLSNCYEYDYTINNCYVCQHAWTL